MLQGNGGVHFFFFNILGYFKISQPIMVIFFKRIHFNNIFSQYYNLNLFITLPFSYIYIYIYILLLLNIKKKKKKKKLRYPMEPLETGAKVMEEGVRGVCLGYWYLRCAL